MSRQIFRHTLSVFPRRVCCRQFIRNVNSRVWCAKLRAHSREMLQGFFKRCFVCDVDAGFRAVDLAHEPAKDLPRTHFHERLYTLGDQHAHGLLPLYCACDLADQRMAATVSILEQCRIHVADDSGCRLVEHHSRKILSQAILRWLHQRAVKWGADWKDFRAFGAAFVGEFGGAFHRRNVTGNDNLLGRVDVGWFADFALRRVAANIGDLLELHAENRRHRAHPDGNGFLHILATMAYSADRIGEVQGSSHNVRRVFAQAMSGDERGLETLFLQYSPSRDGCSQNRWLGDLGKAKLILGTFETKLREPITEDFVGFFKCLPGYGIFFGEFLSHTDGLRSLAREKKCDGSVDS